MEASKDTTKCGICKRVLNVVGDPTTHNCGGDCLRCMAEAGDPDCIEEMKKLGSKMTDREMDKLIAEKVMRWNSYDWPVRRGDRYWSPSTNIEDAWEVIDYLSARGHYVCIERGIDWWAWVGTSKETAKTVPLAICLAVLKWAEL